MRKSVALAQAVLLAACVSAQAGGILIDHTNFDPSGLPQSTMDQIGSQVKVYFAHASVGGNMVGGMGDLHSQNSTRYQMTSVSTGGTPPATTTGGRLYEYNRGNPGWSAKITTFETYMANGWGTDKVDLAMNKFCYIDQAASFASYRDSMLALEAAYSGTEFVYMTMPLTTSCGSNGYLRQIFNEDVRGFCAANDRILFDLADIEAWSPAGVEQTAVYNSHTCQILYGGYTSDGGHLDSAIHSGEPYSGRVRVAMGMYSLYGAVVPEPVSGALLLIGLPFVLRRRRR